MPVGNTRKHKKVSFLNFSKKVDLKPLINNAENKEEIIAVPF